MEHVIFGKTGRKVSRIGFGGAVAGLKNYLGEFDPASNDSFKRVVKALEKALEMGITFFDTAAGYGDHISEKMFGEGLKGTKPEDIFLATKLKGSTRDEVFRSLETSLKSLQRDYVDLIQLHGSSYSTEAASAILAPDGLLSAMEDMKRQGLVKFIGFTSEDNNDSLYRFIRSDRFDTMQICYNFIFQHSYDPIRPFGSLFEADKHGLGISTMRTATSLIFQRWIQMVNPENTFDYTRALIQFVLSNPLVDVALIGMRDEELVLKNIEILEDIEGRIDLNELHNRYV